MRSATLLACDDIRIEANGKLIIIGVYTGNIVLLAPEMPGTNLTFMFNLDVPIDEVPKNVAFEVVLPGEEPDRHALEITGPKLEPHHTRWCLKQVVVAAGKTLRPGRIDAKVVCDGEEIRVSAPWIVAPQNPEATSAPTA
jgi:hypothetical protein